MLCHKLIGRRKIPKYFSLFIKNKITSFFRNCASDISLLLRIFMNFEAILYPLGKRSYLDFSVQIEAVITKLIMNLKVLGG